jgi:CRP/FNR family cyclic AMP-dependent transcriptional regulator
MKSIELEKNELVNNLSQAMIFHSLTKDELFELARACRACQFEDYEEIIKQDSVSPYLYVILTGRVVISVRGESKEGIIISRLTAGDVFGEASIFTNLKRTANVSAEGSATVVSISRESLIEYVNRFPHAGLKIFTSIIYSLLRKLSLASRDLALEKETVVSMEDIEDLKKLFPPSLDDILGAPSK